MNDTPRVTAQGTAQALITAGVELFPERGYDGTSIRALTQRARVNLGAITYHFGSKDGLYEAVASAVMNPFREHVAAAACTAGAPLDRIERVVRSLFGYLQDHPALGLLLMQHLASARPLPSAGRVTMRANIELLASLITEGQEDGSIRPGDPRHMALSIGSQPMFLNLVRHALREGVSINQDDPATSKQVVESVVRFVRAGLATQRGNRP